MLDSKQEAKGSVYSNNPSASPEQQYS